MALLKTSIQPLEACLALSKEKVLRTYGGKALGLWESLRLGLPIPPTWLLSIDAFEHYLNEANKISPFEWIKTHLKALLEELPDVYYAVRSSSQFEDAHEHSFAGIFQSQLGIAKSHLAEAIAAVWESCSSLKATTYSHATDFKMGVVLQPFLKAKFAGVAFSRHPSPSSVFENQHVVIEFSPHGGEAVVQGEVTPFRLSGNPSDLLNATDSPWINDLLKTLQSLVQHFRYEVDIEFVIDEQEKFWLVQQRPISRLHASHILDLTPYKRRYKRALQPLDIELLIEGCSLSLAGYLELPFSLERWMVMITGEDRVQELWIHEALDQAMVYAIGQKVSLDFLYLARVRQRYANHHLKILTFDYASLVNPKISLEKRFFAFCEFILPLEAHYYVPMLVLDALHHLLIQHMQKIDEKKAEDDLFFLGTWGVSSLMELLEDKLREISSLYGPLPSSFHQLPKPILHHLQGLSNEWGFLKCRDAIDEGFSAEELFHLTKKIPLKDTLEDHLFQKTRSKYFPESSQQKLLEAFREWMRIRNQEMEYYLYALQKSRPLFQEIAHQLNCSLSDLWSTSREKITQALRSKKVTSLQEKAPVTIYRSFGRTHVHPNIRLLAGKNSSEKTLKGKTVVGSHKLKAKVKLAFQPHSLKDFRPQEPTALVTGMTTPDFIPYLREHFKALITDEGGILCHAAIVAREIPLPTIVGTGIATEALKEGQWIEIDFDRGEINPL